jgi:flagellar protein FlaF
MQTPNHASTAEPMLAFPNGAASAYGSVIRSTEAPRDIELRVFEKVTAALESASAPNAHFTQKIQAAHDNRVLWQTLAADLAGEDNALPVDLRARLLSLAIWVAREAERVIHEGAGMQDMIEINRSIMLGLRTSSQGAV